MFIGVQQKKKAATSVTVQKIGNSTVDLRLGMKYLKKETSKFINQNGDEKLGFSQSIFGARCFL